MGRSPLPPPPRQCGASVDPFAELVAMVTLDAAIVNDDLPRAVLQITSRNQQGFTVNDVRATGATVVARGPADGGSYPVYPVTDLRIVLAPASVAAVIVVEVDLGCGERATTKRYQIDYRTASDGGPVLRSLP